MKKLFFLVIVGLIIAGCGGTSWQRYSLVDYSYDQQKKQLLPSNKQEVVGAPDPAAQQLLLAQRVISMAEGMTDQTAKLAVIEIVGRHYLPEGYGEKRIDSRDGTVVVSGSPAPATGTKPLPGFSYEKGAYFWNEVDPLHKKRLNYGDMDLIYIDPQGEYATGMREVMNGLYNRPKK